MRIAGVDPGTIRTGIAILEETGRDFQVVFAATIQAGAGKPIADRLKRIYEELITVFRTWNPESIALESVFFQKDFKAAVKVGEARAAAMLAASQCEIPVTEYPPARVKQSVCGNGRATKDQIQFMVRQLLRIKTPMGADTADAIAIAMCHFHTYRFERLKKEAVACV